MQPEHKQHFLIDGMSVSILMRNRGLDMMNETLSGSRLNSPVFIEALETLHRWTYIDRIIPSAADKQSFSTEASHIAQRHSYFTRILQCFHWPLGLTQLRLFDDFADMELPVVPPPDGGFRTRAPVLAALFPTALSIRISPLFPEISSQSRIFGNHCHSADAIPPMTSTHSPSF